MSDRVDIAIIGAGSRGVGYARYALEHPKEAQIVAVAEPRKQYREKLAKDHGIPANRQFEDWRELADHGRLARAAIIATPDSEHVGPALALADQGYQIMLEKPMAPDEEGCRKVAAAIDENEAIFAIGHVLRYTEYTRILKEVIDSGRIGQVVGIQQLEPVGYWHQAHSFVRGNWRNESESSFMLLAKCCHDIDWIRYIMGQKFRAVSSFGCLKHFRSEERPAGAGDRCINCPVEPECPYSAKRIYGRFMKKGSTGWPLDVLAADADEDSIEKALREGQYGRCVYACDNDVVDHQTVNMEFINGGTATLTMIAFTEANARQTRIFGTKGEIVGDGSVLSIYEFLTEKWEEIDTREASVSGGHGGGDAGLMRAFVAAVAQNDQSQVLGGCEETLESHLAVFAAEKARKESSVVTL